MRAPPSLLVSSSSSASMPLNSDESSLFAIESIAGTTASNPGDRLRPGLAVPSSASSIIEWIPLRGPVLVAPPAPSPAVAPAASQAGWWVVGGLAAALVGLAAVVLTSAPPTVIVRTAAAPSEAATLSSATFSSTTVPSAATPSAATPSAAPSAATMMPSDVAPALLPAAALADASADPEPVADTRPNPRAAKRPKRPKRPTAKTENPPKVGKPPIAVPAPSKPQSNNAGSSSLPSVECVLDPTQCGANPHKPAPPAPDEPVASVAEKPPAAQLRTGLAAVKPAAKQCGRTHAVPPGTRVKVRLSVAGATGRVTQAVVQGDYANTALAACLAAAAKGATFPEFTKPSIGALYTFRL